MKERRVQPLVRSLGFAILVGSLYGCDIGGVVIAENNSGQELLARATGSTTLASPRRFAPYEAVVVLPPGSRLVVADLPFAGQVRMSQVEILTPDCGVVGTFTDFARDGTLIVIRDGPKAEIRDEFPRSGTPAESTDRCHTQITQPSPSS
jgi:hypothetical protein